MKYFVFLLTFAFLATSALAMADDRLTNAQRFARGLNPKAPNGFVKRNGRFLPSRTRSNRRATPSGISTSAPTVTIDNTVITGFYNSTSGTDTFLGIPYAQAPTGSQRFKAASDYDYSVAQTISATAFGPACYQVIAAQTIVVRSSANNSFSEDCLSINVYTPSGSEESSYPVMLYIYGGAFGKGTSYLYDGGALVATSIEIGKPVVIVTFNYRVGVLGGLKGTTPAANGGLNAGLKDQRQAMQWVQNHISKFGGDPTKVTLFGQSAGAMSVSLQLMDEDQSLFQGAIMMSGAPTGYPVVVPATADYVYNGLTALTLCDLTVDSFACLSDLPIATLIAAVTTMQSTGTATYGANAFGPSIDGDLIPASPRTLMSEGKFSKVPMIMGDVLDEGTAFSTTTAASDAAVTKVLSFGWPTGSASMFTDTDSLDAWLALYADICEDSPFNTGNDTFGYTTYWKKQAAMFGDMSFQAPRRRFAQAAMDNGVNLWQYEFVAVNDPTLAWAGSYHSIELQWLFNSFSKDSSEYALSKTMTELWTSFAYNLDPSTSSGISWPQSDSSSSQLLQINHTLSFIPDTYRTAGMNTVNDNDDLFYSTADMAA